VPGRGRAAAGALPRRAPGVRVPALAAARGAEAAAATRLCAGTVAARCRTAVVPADRRSALVGSQFAGTAGPAGDSGRGSSCPGAGHGPPRLPGPLDRSYLLPSADGGTPFRRANGDVHSLLHATLRH